MYIEYDTIFIKLRNKRIFIFKEIKFFGVLNTSTARGVLFR